MLIAELKDRDKELNDIVSLQQRQLLAWQNDRQKILTLEQKCARLESRLLYILFFTPTVADLVNVNSHKHYSNTTQVIKLISVGIYKITGAEVGGSQIILKRESIVALQKRKRK